MTSSSTPRDSEAVMRAQSALITVARDAPAGQVAGCELGTQLILEQRHSLILDCTSAAEVVDQHALAYAHFHPDLIETQLQGASPEERRKASLNDFIMFGW